MTDEYFKSLAAKGSMNNFLGYQCSLCGKTFDASYQGYVCDADAGNLDVILDYQRIRASVSTGRSLCVTRTIALAISPAVR
jgi:hypothetical protein